MAARHADVLPDVDQILLAHAQQVDALAAGHLDGGDLVLVDGIGDAAQLVGGGLPAPHARDHRIGPVLLDVGVAALVDEARLRIVHGLLRPGGDQVVVERRTAGRAAVGRLPVQAVVDLVQLDQVLLEDGVAHLLVAELGASAHGLLLRRGRVVAARGEHQQLLDQAGAGAAARAGLGVLAHLLQREQALLLDRLADGALGHAVAAADLVAVGHRGGLVVALVADVADVALAEHQLVPDVADLAALAQQLEVPAAIDGVAVQAGADQLVVLDHELLVDAGEGIAHHDLLGALAAHEVAGREQVDAGHLQLGAGLAAEVAADAELRQVVRADLALLEQRRHQAVGDAAVRGAFADGVDAGIGHRLQCVGDDDAAVAVQAGAFGQRGVGADAGGHHNQVGGDLLAILEAHRHHAAVLVADQRLGLRTHAEAQAALLQRLAQQVASLVVELALHQPVADVHDGDLHAAQHQAVGRFQAQQAAADDDGVLVLGGRLDHRVGVGDVAVADHTVQVLAGHRQDEGVGAGGDQQPVVVGFGAVGRDHLALDAIDLRDRLAQVQRDAVLLVPGERVQDDLVQRLLAGEHRAEQDAVVVRMRLGAEHGDVVQIGRDLQQLFQGADAGHAVAHHHQLHLFHAARSNRIRAMTAESPPP